MHGFFIDNFSAVNFDRLGVLYDLLNFKTNLMIAIILKLLVDKIFTVLGLL